MPLYDHRCPDCCMVHEAIMPIDEKTRDCPHCDGIAQRCFSPRYTVIGDVDFVTDDLDGTPKRYTSKKDLEKDLKDKGLYEKIGKGWV